MAISSLTRFGVPLANNQSANNQGLLFPKLKYRFRVLLQNFGVSRPTTELTKQVVSCTRPEVTFETKMLHVYNSIIHYGAKPMWGEISLIARDDVTNAVSKLSGEQVQKQFDFFEQSSAVSSADYKFTTVIEMLDGGNGAYEPGVLERFELTGCFLTKVKYDDTDYSNSDPITIALTIKYDNAIQVGTSGAPVGIGVPVGPRPNRTGSTGG
jgi:hypothetical protein